MIAAWLLGGPQHLSDSEREKLLDELRLALTPFQAGGDPETLAAAAPLLELLDSGARLERAFIHALLAELVLALVAAWNRMAEHLKRSGLTEAADVAFGEAAALTASAHLHLRAGQSSRSPLDIA
jgi:hypothetical protein